MVPLKQWICDTCQEVIEKPEDGWLEWVKDRSSNPSKRHSFNIIHQLAASPRQPRGDCYQHADKAARQDLALERLVEKDGLVRFMPFLDPGPLHDPDAENVIQPSQVREIVEIMRRLYVPYFEEARLCWEAASSNGEFDGDNEYSSYTESKLKRILDEYRNFR